MGSRLHGSDGVSSVILRSAATKSPRLCSSAAIAHPKSVAQRDVGAVREPPLRDPIVISAPRIGVRGRRRAGIQGRGVGNGGGLGFFTAFRMTGTRDHSCGLRPSVIPAHERESRRGGGDGLPSVRERRSIVRHSEERSDEESQALLSCLRFTSKVGCPARCRGGSRTAPTGSHRHFRHRIGVRGRRRAGIQGRGVGNGGGLGFFTAFRMTGTRDHPCGLRPSVIPAHERESRRGGGDGLPSARERRSIVRHSEERSEEESQALLVRRHCTSRVGCPARCRGGSRTAPTRSHHHSRPRAGIQGSGGVCTGKTNAPTPSGFLTDVVQY